MNTKYLFGFVMLCITILTSCQKDELLYSCNPTIDKWAKDHLSEIGTMTRAQFLDLGEAYQRAAFNAFPPQQRINLWKEKLEETLQLEWTSSERSHIEALLNMVLKNNTWFENVRSQEVIEHYEIETYRWNDDAINNLQWDLGTIYAITYTLSTVIKNNDKVLVVESPLSPSGANSIKTKSESGGGGICECHVGNFFSNLNCLFKSGFSVICEDDDCWFVPAGCGSLCLQSCDGVCKYYNY